MNLLISGCTNIQKSSRENISVWILKIPVNSVIVKLADWWTSKPDHTFWWSGSLKPHTSCSKSHRASMGSSFWGVSLLYFRGRTCRLRLWRPLTRSSMWSTALAWSYSNTGRMKRTVIPLQKCFKTVFSFLPNEAHIQLGDQTLRLINVFVLWAVLLVDFRFQPLQQVLSVACFLVELQMKTHQQTGISFSSLSLWALKSPVLAGWPCDIHPCASDDLPHRWAGSGTLSSQHGPLRYAPDDIT